MILPWRRDACKTPDGAPHRVDLPPSHPSDSDRAQSHTRTHSRRLLTSPDYVESQALVLIALQLESSLTSTPTPGGRCRDVQSWEGHVFQHRDPRRNSPGRRDSYSPLMIELVERSSPTQSPIHSPPPRRAGRTSGVPWTQRRACHA